MNKPALIVSALLATLILAGCGGNAAQTTPEPAPATEAAPQPTEIPATEEAATEAPTTEEVVVEAPATDEVVAAISYAAQIQPIFDNKCIKCHGVDSVKEGLDMRTYDALMAGSHNGAVIVPGDAENSVTVDLLVRGKMPKRGPKLTAEETQLIIDWVTQGAQNN